MPQLIGVGPFEEFNLTNRLWPQPYRLLHLLRVECATPPWLSCFRQVGERALLRHQRPKLFKKSPPRCWHKSVPSPRYVHQLISLVVAHDQRVEAVRTRCEAANHELLAEINPVLDPGSATLSGFVHTVLPLSNDSFQSLFSYRRQHSLG